MDLNKPKMVGHIHRLEGAGCYGFRYMVWLNLAIRLKVDFIDAN